MSETPAPAPETPPSATPVAAPRRSLVPLLSLCVSVVALATALSAVFLPGYVTQAQPDMSAYTRQLDEIRQNQPDTKALQAQISALEQRLSILESAPAPTAAPATAVDLTPLENRLRALEARPVTSTTALEGELAHLRQQIGQNSHSDDAQKTVLVATLQLVSAWQQGQPFEAPWLALTSAADAADQELSVDLDDAAPTLLPFRDKGIQVLSSLTTGYGDMAQKVMASAATPSGSSWWQQSLDRVKGLVVIRRQGEAVSADDTATDAILARGETRLQSGDLSAAVAELEKLDDTATAAAVDWLSAARARLLADSLASKLTQHSAGLLAGGTSSPAAADEAAP